MMDVYHVRWWLWQLLLWQGLPSMKSGGSGQGLYLSAHLITGTIKNIYIYILNLRSCSDFFQHKNPETQKPPANVLSVVTRAPPEGPHRS